MTLCGGDRRRDKTHPRITWNCRWFIRGWVQEAAIRDQDERGADRVEKGEAEDPPPKKEKLESVSDQRGKVFGRVDNEFVFQQLLKKIIVCPVMKIHVLTIDQAQKGPEFGRRFAERTDRKSVV